MLLLKNIWLIFNIVNVINVVYNDRVLYVLYMKNIVLI